MFDYWGLRRKYNTLLIKYEELEENIKNDLYNEITKLIKEKKQVKRYQKENTRLRKENKELKKELRDGRTNKQIRKNS